MLTHISRIIAWPANFAAVSQFQCVIARSRPVALTLLLLALLPSSSGCQSLLHSRKSSLFSDRLSAVSSQTTPHLPRQNETAQPTLDLEAIEEEPRSDRLESSEELDIPPIRTASHQLQGDESFPIEHPPVIAPREIPRFEHDAATQRLINSALGSIPEGERENWQDYLATIDPRMVPFVLSTKDLSRRPPSTSSTLAVTEVQEPGISPEYSRVSQSKPNLSQPLVTPIAEATEQTLEDQTKVHHQQPAVNEIDESNEPGVLEPATEPATEDSDRGWGNPIKSLAEWEGSPLRFHRQKAGDVTESSSKPNLGLPRILGGSLLSKEQDAVAPEAPQTLQPPVAMASDEQMRIAPGNELWEDELQKLISLMKVQTTAVSEKSALSEDELRQQVAVRLLQLINGQPQLAQQPIPGLTPSEQEFWTALFWALSDYIDPAQIDASERATHVLSQLRSATLHLEVGARLQLKNVNFCQRIDGFGSYEEFDRFVFEPGQRVLIYAEIKNFESQLTSTNQFSTRIRSLIEIREVSETGRVVESSEFPATEDVSRTRRTDYYHAYRIDLPDHLQPGVYSLQLTVIDETAAKRTSELIEFVVR